MTACINWSTGVTQCMFLYVPYASCHLIVGQLCQLMETGSSSNIRQSCSPLQSYLTSLSSSCNSGDPGTLIWTPDESTPNTVYYQVLQTLLPHISSLK